MKLGNTCGADAVRQQGVFAQVAAECDVTRLLAADIERFREATR